MIEANLLAIQALLVLIFLTLRRITKNQCDGLRVLEDRLSRIRIELEKTNANKP